MLNRTYYIEIIKKVLDSIFTAVNVQVIFSVQVQSRTDGRCQSVWYTLSYLVILYRCREVVVLATSFPEKIYQIK